jgi:hypothetical protein
MFAVIFRKEVHAAPILIRRDIHARRSGFARSVEANPQGSV